MIAAALMQGSAEPGWSSSRVEDAAASNIHGHAQKSLKKVLTLKQQQAEPPRVTHRNTY